jgi:hypothetical protein
MRHKERWISQIKKSTGQDQLKKSQGHSLTKGYAKSSYSNLPGGALNASDSPLLCRATNRRGRSENFREDAHRTVLNKQSITKKSFFICSDSTFERIYYTVLLSSQAVNYLRILSYMRPEAEFMNVQFR